jgi:penicillin G amidase
LPHVLNPPEGYIVTANNKVASDHYPYMINFRWSVPPYRAARITDVLKENLKANQPFTVSLFKTLQYDTVSLLWRSLSPALLETKPLDNDSKIALNYLKNWDGRSTLESIPQTIFAYWYRELGGFTPSFLLKLMPWPEPLYIKNQLINNQTYLSKSLQEAMQKLIHDKGSDPKNWSWQNIHHAVFTELGLGVVPGLGLFWNREIPSPGSLYTVNAGTYNMSDLQQKDGPGYRQIIDLSDFNHSLYIQSLGQSNDPSSSHYQDMMPLWCDGKYLPINSDKNIWGKTKVLILTPK